MLFLRGIEFGFGMWVGVCLCTIVVLALAAILERVYCRMRRLFPKSERASPKRSILGSSQLLSMSPEEFECLYGSGFDRDGLARKKPPIRATVCTVISWEDRPRHSKRRRRRMGDYENDLIG